MVMDLNGVDFALKYVIGAPGHVERKPLHECVEMAKDFGLVREFPYKLVKAIMPRYSEVHYEMFAGGRLLIIRATASDCLAMDDMDAGHALIDQSVFMLLPDHQVRYFLIDICPDASKELWLRPRVELDGTFWLKCREWTWKAPVSDIADSLWVVLKDIAERKKWKDYCKQASLLRISMMRRLLDGEQVDPFKMRIPPMSRGRWYPDMIEHAYALAQRNCSTVKS